VSETRENQPEQARQAGYGPAQPPDASDLLGICIRFDGGHYARIIRDGYAYDPARRSVVAFFPAYPLLTYSVSQVTGLGTEAGLLLVSNASLAAAFALLALYARVRRREGVSDDSTSSWILLSFGLWPTAFFLHMAYSESLLLACALLTLYGIARGWPLVLLAVIAGFATATRPVGVAVTAALVWHVIRLPGSLPARLARAGALLPLGTWGLLAYMVYQWMAFGNPLAFAQTQENWSWGAPASHDCLSKLYSLVTLEPVLGVYDPDSARFWWRTQANGNPLFVLTFWNPIAFLFSVGLLVLGACRRWLNGPEIVLSASLLAIPYLTRAYEMSMGSHARFATVVISNYLVMGKLLGSAPPPVAGVVASLSAVFLALWTALYIGGYPFF